MFNKFKNKYKTDSTRLKKYDYSQNGMYFVTICIKDHKHFFGDVVDGKMILNDIGKIADKLWQEIPKYFKFVKLDVHQVMPNHLHGNLEIFQNDNVEARFIVSNKENVETRFIVPETNQDAINRVSTIEEKNGGITGKDNPMLKQFSLSKIIRWYKGRCSFEIRKYMDNANFAWQPKFYDHIIRDNESLNKVREYIIKNPEMWEKEGDKIENIF